MERSKMPFYIARKYRQVIDYIVDTSRLSR